MWNFCDNFVRKQTKSITELGYILPILYAGIFILLIRKLKFFSVDGLSKNAITVLFLLKIFFGILLWAIYTYHYTYRNTSDAYRFFDDAIIIFNSTKGNFRHFAMIIFGINENSPELQSYLANTFSWYRPFDYGLINDDRTMIRFNALLLFFSFGYYHVHTVFLNFMSLIGLVAIFKTFVRYLPDRKSELVLAVFFIPTVLFWGSGVLKEGLILFALGIFVYAFFNILKAPFALKPISKNPGILCLSLFILCLVKVYVLMCIIPAVVSMLVIKISGEKKAAMKFFTAHVILIIAALNIHFLFPDYNILEMISIKQRDFYNVAQLWQAGSTIDIGRLEPTIISFFTHIPQALYCSLFRPHIFEADSLFLYAAAIENLLFLVLIVFYLLNLQKIPGEKLSIVLFSVSFVIFLALLVGWTTPIMGAIVRYKLPLLPFLLFSLLLISRKPEMFVNIENYLCHQRNTDDTYLTDKH